MTQTIHGRSLDEWVQHAPVIGDLVALRETSWFPQVSGRINAEAGLTKTDIDAAAARLNRFAPFFRAAFPETATTDGIIESPLVPASRLQKEMGDPSSLWLKLDNALPVSGSVKARGGFHEVLAVAERLAVGDGLLSIDDDYSTLASPPFTEFFSGYSIVVGSTGNLGLSIGILSAELGFHVTVHMSADAREWKKSMLRDHGVEVVEHESDYSTAVASGRDQAMLDPRCHFVDDENSRDLFLGYAVAARRLAGQLREAEVAVDKQRPLIVYLPCGVGGGPGGIAFGLHTEFGENVYPVFVEPTHCPSMTLGVATGLHDGVDVHDFGIDNTTAADGLACGRPSGFVGRTVEGIVGGYLTVDDDNLYRNVALLDHTEGIRAEPSAVAGLVGVLRTTAVPDFREAAGLSPEQLENATHIAWLTGGGMVPETEMSTYLRKGSRLMANGGDADR